MTAAPPVATQDPQDPLPESNWEWRRWFIFSTQGLLIGALLYALHQSTEMAAAWVVGGIIANSIFYLCAPSAEQVAKMFASVSAMKAGISFTSPPTPGIEGERPDLDIPPMPGDVPKPDPNK